MRTAYTSGRFSAGIDGFPPLQWVKSISGGMPESEVISDRFGLTSDEFKAVGTHKIPPIDMTVALGACGPMLTWLKAALEGLDPRPSGFINYGDSENDLLKHFHFRGAVLTEFGFPGLDASQSSTAEANIKFQVEHSQRAPGKGKISRQDGGGKAKLVSTRRFRLSMDGPMAEACEHVSKIDGFSITQEVSEYRHGDPSNQYPELSEGDIKIPDLTFTLPSAYDKAFSAAYAADRRAVMGVGGYTGAIEFQTEAGTPVFEVGFSGAGIKKVEEQKSEANSGNIQNTQVTLYLSNIHIANINLG